jgi:hypothetical protein
MGLPVHLGVRGCKINTSSEIKVSIFSKMVKDATQPIVVNHLYLALSLSSMKNIRCCLGEF